MSVAGLSAEQLRWVKRIHDYAARFPLTNGNAGSGYC